MRTIVGDLCNINFDASSLTSTRDIVASSECTPEYYVFVLGSLRLTASDSRQSHEYFCQKAVGKILQSSYVLRRVSQSFLATEPTLEEMAIT